MNTTPFPGSGIRMSPKVAAEAESMNFAYEADRIKAAERAADDDLMADAFADAVSEVLEQQKLPTTDRSIFERSIANRRKEKARQQAIAAAALAKVKQLTASIRSMEDALDGLLVSEA